MKNGTMVPVGMSEAEAIARLYNRAGTAGLGRWQFKHGRMSIEQATPLCGQHLDWVQGRIMKIDTAAMMAGAPEWEWLYERDNGKGSALEALTSDDYAPESP